MDEQTTRLAFDLGIMDSSFTLDSDASALIRGAPRIRYLTHLSGLEGLINGPENLQNSHSNLQNSHELCQTPSILIRYC